MVHALYQTHRALKADGLLFDLRPASVNTTVGILWAAGFEALGRRRYNFEHDYAADVAVGAVLREGGFALEAEAEFEFQSHMDALNDLFCWLDENQQPDDPEANPLLLDLAARKLKGAPAGTKIMATGRLKLNVLRKK